MSHGTTYDKLPEEEEMQGRDPATPTPEEMNLRQPTGPTGPDYGTGPTIPTPTPGTAATMRTGDSDTDSDDETDEESGGGGGSSERVRARRSDPNYFLFKHSDYTMSLLIPVSLTMAIVVFAVKVLTPEMDPALRPVYLVVPEKPSDSGGKKLGGALLNALVVVVAFVVVTCLLVLLYKYRCYKAIGGWFVITSLFMLFFMGWMWVDLFCAAYALPYDWVTILVVMWNFAIVGVVTIYWRGHKTLIQLYLVAVACMMGWFVTRLPEWTTWVILLTIALYDLFAVLSPRGPLKVLVEESIARNEPIPGLVYESKSYKLGLGDFVFYSVLVGRAAMYFYTTWAICYIAVLLGLCGTLFCLGLFRKALPALPISIFCGTAFYFLSRFLINPYLLHNTISAHWF